MVTKTGKPLIATPEFLPYIPCLPEGYEWSIVRNEVDGKPKMDVALYIRCDDAINYTRLKHGRIDVEMYGEWGAVIQLAQDIYRRVFSAG